MAKEGGDGKSVVGMAKVSLVVPEEVWTFGISSVLAVFELLSASELVKGGNGDGRFGDAELRVPEPAELELLAVLLEPAGDAKPVELVWLESVGGRSGALPDKDELPELAAVELRGAREPGRLGAPLKPVGELLGRAETDDGRVGGAKPEEVLLARFGSLLSVGVGKLFPPIPLAVPLGVPELGVLWTKKPPGWKVVEPGAARPSWKSRSKFAIRSSSGGNGVSVPFKAT